MLYTKRAACFARALRQATVLILGHVISLLLSRVTIITKVSLTPTVPRSNTTAKLALVLYELLSMNGATSLISPTAPTTDKLLRFELAVTITSIAALLATKVEFLAFEAWVIGKAIHGERLRIVIEPCSWLLNILVILQSLKGEPLNGISSNFLLHLRDRAEFIFQRRVAHWALANRAVTESKCHSSAGPSLLQLG